MKDKSQETLRYFPISEKEIAKHEKRDFGFTFRKENVLPRMKQNQWTMPYQYKSKTKCLREKYFIWILDNVRHRLELRYETIGKTFILFDFFVCKLYERHLQSKKSSQFEPDKNDLLRIVISCLFSCSKYEEIYAPCLTDFSMITNLAVSTDEILRTQREICIETNFAFDLQTVGFWYSQLFYQKIPDWGYRSYIKCYACNGEQLAKAIFEVESQRLTLVKERLTIEQKFMVKKVLAILKCKEVEKKPKSISVKSK